MLSSFCAASLAHQWQLWSQQVAAQVRAAYRDEMGNMFSESQAIQHTVLFKFPGLEAGSEAARARATVALLQCVVLFNELPGISAQFTAHGTATLAKHECLKALDWPDKTEGYTHCLLIVADDEASLKNYLHHDHHLKAWMTAVGPLLKGIVVFDSRLKVQLNPTQYEQLHPVLFRLKESVDAGELQLHVEKFNKLDGIRASLEPFLGAQFLESVEWPDKCEGFTWCLTVLTRDTRALKSYLHSAEHAAWAASVGPHVDAARGSPLLVFDVPLRVRR